MLPSNPAPTLTMYSLEAGRGLRQAALKECAIDGGFIAAASCRWWAREPGVRVLA